MPTLSPARQTLLLFLLALAVLVPGIWEATGLTGKDEFFLGLRTPMEMIEGDHWLVPFLDGAPRIRKPPLLYWLGRASFETFGISLVSARFVAALFAALLVVSTAGIARRLSGKNETGLIAGCVLLGCLGIASEGRRFMLDVPVAALSTAAFWSLLAWLDSGQKRWLTAAAVLLAAGFLTKGPIVALVCGGGVLALLATGRWRVPDLARQWRPLAGNALLFAVLALPWFFVVRALYPEAADLVLAGELESRQFFNLSPGILLGLLNVALPWVFVFAVAAVGAWGRSAVDRLALLWFLATFLPFAFIRSFDRYLIGSLVPLSILVALALPAMRARWPFRLGLILALLLGAGFAGFTFWFGLGGWYWLLVPAGYFAWAWWRERSAGHTLAAPAVYWAALLWGVFPAIGVNAVPDAVRELGKSRDIAMFDGPQPALLPILSQRTLRHYGQFDRHDLAELKALNALVFLESRDVPRLQAAVAAAGLQARQIGSYQTLASHGSGLRFARVGATVDDWKRAFAARDLAPLMTTVVWFEIVAP
ncbi:glycosyltransferase family 39 protein [Dechloromonas sp. H13]|uniref:ArnT family glycosyltransferase n=1 Tax=Dechloromonas sp. H13 TaxID=2570193 RepID=UPI0012920516|nr:glycosyltransferase family 39 protein [Dechloromonas sp. H13]